MLPLIILAGPTTSKKSLTAISLAELLGTEIINADSVQVYKYFNIGAAKPSLQERKGIPHHLIDILEPDQEFSAHDFKVRALEHGRELMNNNRIPVVVGGTGLYLKVLTEDLNCAVATSPEIKKKLQEDLEAKGAGALHEELKRIDPKSAERIQPNDPVRIERALAVYLQTGKTMSDFRESDSPSGAEFPVLTFHLEWDRKQLYKNIGRRIDRMIEKGLKKEVKSDNTPVTNGDIEVNNILIKKISALTPEIPIVSEEFESGVENWYIDSIRSNIIYHATNLFLFNACAKEVQGITTIFW